MHVNPADGAHPVVSDARSAMVRACNTRHPSAWSAKFLALIGCLLIWVTPAVAKEEAKAPNIVFLYVDDMNDWVGYLGGQGITPNLDKLARRGVVFTSMQVPATFCTPSRTATMTGRHPTSSGDYRNQPFTFTNPDETSLNDWFGRHGYDVYGTGKVYHHMPGYLDRRGFREYFHWNPDQKAKGWGLRPWAKPAPAPVRPVTDIPDLTGWDEFDIAALPNEDEDRMADTIGAKWAAGVVSRKHDRPFMLMFGTFAPHKPNFVPKRYFDLYKDRTVFPPPILAGDIGDLPGDIHNKPLCCSNPRYPKAGTGAWPSHEIIVENGLWETALRGYLASVSYADAQLGRVLDALEQGPNAHDTVVVFLSDNGYHLGEKDKWAKHSLWQRTTNVPFIIAGPGVPSGKTTSTVASTLDIFPTLTRMAGVQSPANLDGTDLASILRHPERSSGRKILISGNEGEYAVVTDKWRYIRYGFGGEELYKTRSDRNEWHNLISTRKGRRVADKLAAAVPLHPAKSGKDSQQGEIRLVIDGQDYHWAELVPGEPIPTSTED